MNLHLALPQMRAIAEQIAPHCDGDTIFQLDMIEGESGHDPRWLVERLHEQLARDDEMLVGIKEREAALKDRKSRIEARRDTLKGQIGKVLRAVQLSKLELPEATYSVRDGNPKLVVCDADAVPDEMTRVKRAPDMAEIKAHYEHTAALPNWLRREPASDIVTGRTR